MKKAVVVVCVLFVSLVAAASAQAACTLHAQSELSRGGWYRVFWDPVAGAATYHVEILRVKSPGIPPEHFSNVDTTGASVDVRFLVASDAKLVYRVTAVNDQDAAFEPCSSSVELTLPASAPFRKLTRKLILPMAGSTAGANGARFRTSLKLSRTFNDQYGRIVFHRGGQLPSDADPSLTYNFATASSPNEIEYEDVIEAMGMTGIGYLEIVPDENASDVMPRVEARLYNDGPGGTFGTLEDAVLPADHTDVISIAIPAPDERFRVNVGIVPLGQAAAILTVDDANNKRKVSRTLDVLEGVFMMSSLQELARIEILPTDQVRLTVLPNGAAIPFYTLTENKTNDPELVVPARTLNVDVGAAIK